jgi:oligopeptide transport system substrate-binding protein
MRARKRGSLALTLLMLASASLAGCTDEETVARPDPADEPKIAQSINLPLADEVPTLDISKATDTIAFTVLTQINEGLVRLDGQGKVVPGVAKEWKRTADGLTYTFVLRDDAKWSDGSTVTAQDFVYSWKRTLDPATNAQYAFMLEWIKGGAEYHGSKGRADDVKVEAKDPRTLEVTLTAPVPFFLEQMAFPIFFPQKKEFVGKQADQNGNEADRSIANGPFKVSSWKHEQSLVLVKNDTYWDRSQVRLERVNWQVVKDSTAAENLYQTGQLDRVTLVQDQVDRYKSSPELQTVSEPVSGYIQFNRKVKVFGNAKIRKALSYAIDGDAYADFIYHNGSKGATGFVPTGISNGQGGEFRQTNGDLLHRSENVKQAKQLLEEGLREQGLTQFPKVRLLGDDGDVGKKAGDFLREQWRRNLGIEVEIENVPFKLRLQRSAAGDFDMVESLWAADYNDPMTFLDLLVTDGEFNQGRYSNPDYDRLIQAAKGEPDPAKRMKHLYDAEKVLIEDMPVAPTFFRGASVLMKPYVKGFVTRTFGPRYDLKNVYIEGK